MKITDKEAAVCKRIMGEQEFYAAAPWRVKQVVKAYRMGVKYGTKTNKRRRVS